MRRTNQTSLMRNERSEEYLNNEDDAASGYNSENENDNREKEQDDKNKKIKKKRANNRVLFKPDHLINPDKGLKKLYEWTNKLKLDTFDNKKEVELLNQYLRLFKEWQFNLIPRFDINYFILRCQRFGREERMRKHLSKMRSAHSGLKTWEDIQEEFENEQNLFNTENINETQPQATQQTPQITQQTQNSRINLQSAQNNLKYNNPFKQPKNTQQQKFNTKLNTSNLNTNINRNNNLTNISYSNEKGNQLNKSNRNKENLTKIPIKEKVNLIQEQTQEIPVLTETDLANKRQGQSYQTTLQINDEFDNFDMEIETRNPEEYAEDPEMEGDFAWEEEDTYQNNFGDDLNDQDNLTETDLAYKIKKVKPS